jgi:septal ring factor EnvC (AmiA/AmiB activator)
MPAMALRLVIVKHSGNLLSAYSFNGRILVSEQQRVRTGQSLAELKPRNGNSQKVHFELRRDGKPINPTGLIKPP